VNIHRDRPGVAGPPLTKGIIMKTSIGIVATLALAAGLALAPSAWAQPEQGCEEATGEVTGTGAQASEQTAEYVPDPGCEVGKETDEPAMGSEAKDEGSQAPETGVGGQQNQ